MKNSKKQITDEDIEKAFNELEEEAELLKAEEDQLDEDEEVDLEEDEEDEGIGEDDEEEEEEEEEEDEDTEKANDDEIEKAKKDDDDEDEDEDEDDEDEDDEDEDDEEEDKKKRTKKGKKIKKALDDDEDDDEDEDYSGHNESVRKGIEVSEFLKGLVDEIDLGNRKTRSTIANVGLLVKGLTDEISILKERLDNVENAPRQRKSISKEAVVERFNKGAEDEVSNSKPKVLHIKNDYARISNLLDAKTFGANQDKFDAEFAKGLTEYEATKTLSSSIVERIEKEEGIKIIQ